MKRRVIFGLLILGLFYAADSFWLHYRMSKGWNPIGTTTTNRYYAIQEKNNQVEYVNDGDESQNCVHALFPHLGNAPCWSQSSKKEERIDE